MANIKISELNPLVTVQDADVLPIVDNAVTKKVTAAILRSYTEGNSVLLTGNQTIAGIKTFTSQLSSSVATGYPPFSVASTTKVTNLNADLLDGLSSADFQATLSGSGIVKSTAGTISYLTDNTANWDTAYNDKINSAAVTGSGTNTLTLTQQDAGTITATWVNGTLIREVRNTTGATLTKGTIVYISGATGNKPTVTKAIASGDSTSAQTFGFIQSDLANNANGYVVVVGDLTGVDTSAFAEGAQLYLSSTVAGTFTSTKQYAPAHLVYVGIVTRSHPTLGQIEVNIQNGYELDELHNVSAQSPSNGDILQFVTSTGLWTKVAGTTTNISEGTNLYFTNARSRSAISESVTGLDYNSTTGVLSTTSGYGIPTTASQATWDTAYNDSIVSAAVTGTTTKTLTLNQQDGGSVTASWTDDNTDAVSSVFGRTGAVVAASGDYTTTQVTEGTNLYYTEARVNANSNVAANTAARHNAVTLGTANGLSLSTQALSLALASGSTTGALSSTDWTTFNNKQNALTNPITGTGTTNYLPKFTGTSALGNSALQEGTSYIQSSKRIEADDAGYGLVAFSSAGNRQVVLGVYLGEPAIQGTLLNGTARQLSINANGGNVLIGTTTDAGYKLDVNGTARISGNTTIKADGGNDQLLIQRASNTNSQLIIGYHSDGYGRIQAIEQNVDFKPLALNQSGGNVLIGTATNSTFKLDVNGTARVSGIATFSSSVTAGGKVQVTGSTSPASGSGLELFYDGSYAGMLGYNRTSPGYLPIAIDGSTVTLFTGSTPRLTIANTGAATFSSSVTTGADATINSIKIGRGTGNISTNTTIGNTALNANTTGDFNTTIGFESLKNNTTGSSNSALGAYSLISNTTGSNNTGLGFQSGYSITTGANNTVIGKDSLSANSTGSNNSALGVNTQSGNFSGSVILGKDAVATAANQFVVGSAGVNAGSVTTEVNASTKVWNVVINGVAYKILLA